jgi:hypothetical protein
MNEQQIHLLLMSVFRRVIEERAAEGTIEHFKLTVGNGHVYSIRAVPVCPGCGSTLRSRSVEDDSRELYCTRCDHHELL